MIIILIKIKRTATATIITSLMALVKTTSIITKVKRMTTQ